MGFVEIYKFVWRGLGEEDVWLGGLFKVKDYKSYLLIGEVLEWELIYWDDYFDVWMF